MNRLTADLLLLLAAFIWGIGFLFQKEAMAHVGPLTFIASRTALAALVLSPLALREQRGAGTPAPTPLLRLTLAGGAVFVLGAWFQQEGLKTASVTNTGFLTALYVVFTPIVAWIIMRKPPSVAILPAIALSFTGTWLLGGGTLAAFQHGDVLITISAVFWAIHVVVTGLASLRLRPVTYTCLQFAVASTLSAIGAVALETPDLSSLIKAAPSIAYVGLLSSAFTFTVLTYAMRATPPAETAILVSAECLFAAAAGSYVLDERLTPMAWTGAALILIAILAVQLVPRASVVARSE